MRRATDISSDRPQETCAKCGGGGWRYAESGPDARVVRCDCYFQKQSERLLEVAHIPARYVGCTFSSYEADNKFSASAKIAVEGWTEQYPLSQTGLILLGNSGVGKTHLAVAALKGLIAKGFRCLFVDYRDLLKQIQNSYNPSVQATELELLQPLFDADVLLLDDLGAVRPTYWVWDTVSLVLNNRYNKNRTTLITSNFIDGPAAGTEEAKRLRATARGNAIPQGPQAKHQENAREEEETLGDRIGERMRSRLFEMCRPVLVGGTDYRRRLRATSLR